VAAQHNSNDDTELEGGHFTVPFEVLRNTALALFLLTALTVFTAKFIHLGALAGVVAFAIAFTKAMLVIMYFMGLKYDSKLNRLIFSLAFVFLIIFAFFSVLDVWTRVTNNPTL
jgi:cytochrome c oxidase subunit 4